MLVLGVGVVEGLFPGLGVVVDCLLFGPFEGFFGESFAGAGVVDEVFDRGEPVLVLNELAALSLVEGLVWADG